MHPLDDVQNGVAVGDLAFLIDDGYRRVGQLARGHQDLDAVWPDTLLHLSFAVSPKLAAGYTGGQFAGIETYPSGLAAEPVGNDMVHYEWTLAGLQLFDVTSDPDGPGTLVPGTLSAAWQAGKDGDMGVRPQAGDLVLLTYQGDLWLNRLADGGAALPHDPLKETASLCEGEHARNSAGRWATALRPPRRASSSPRIRSARIRPSAALRPPSRSASRGCRGSLRAAGRALAPTAPGLRRALDRNLALELDRTFDGILDLGTVGGPVGGRFEMFNTAVIVPSDELEEEAVLWLVCAGYDERTIGVRDDRGEAWQAEAKPLEDGRLALRFAPRPPARSRTCPSSGGSASMSACWVWAESARPPAALRRRARTPAMPRPRVRPPPLPRNRSRRPRPRAPRPAASSSRGSSTGWTST